MDNNEIIIKGLENLQNNISRISNYLVQILIFEVTTVGIILGLNGEITCSHKIATVFIIVGFWVALAKYLGVERSMRKIYQTKLDSLDNDTIRNAFSFNLHQSQNNSPYLSMFFVPIHLALMAAVLIV